MPTTCKHRPSAGVDGQRWRMAEACFFKEHLGSLTEFSKTNIFRFNLGGDWPSCTCYLLRYGKWWWGQRAVTCPCHHVWRALLWSSLAGEMMLLTFIAAAHPSLTHSLFALCFIERDESVFPFHRAGGWPAALPRRCILQTAAAAAAGLISRSMWPTKDGTVAGFRVFFFNFRGRDWIRDLYLSGKSRWERSLFYKWDLQRWWWWRWAPAVWRGLIFTRDTFHFLMNTGPSVSGAFFCLFVSFFNVMRLVCVSELAGHRRSFGFNINFSKFEL